MSTRGGEWWLGGVNSRALQQRDGQVGVVGERWFWRSRTPGTYTVHASGRRYKFQWSSSSRLGSIARERGLGFEARWGSAAAHRAAGIRPPLTSYLAGHQGHGGRADEQVPGGAAGGLGGVGRRRGRWAVGGGRWACRRPSPWGCGIADRGVMWTGQRRKSAPNDPWKLLLAVTWMGGTEPGLELLETSWCSWSCTREKEVDAEQMLERLAHLY
jgi:hypothetical protein